jgi:hypothetical protein
MPNDKGVITVIKPGPKFDYISKNSIGEGMFASPAISNGRIYLRGYRICSVLSMALKTGNRITYKIQFALYLVFAA